ncbi:hypothetical protein KOR34_15140 [Posidoniimonas corsicana]|uniref:Glycosyl hydrolases family 43 n=1 Tax=Posidoniimonas corsicana TaxID=1938618 RepID=A0A5C5VDD7_9BACT|nr:hypothetical protein [Posidoniimonas corsicana]TWT36608.1 hypothetical protein KOR34_15140 [Posidoniimonas corsicana]
MPPQTLLTTLVVGFTSATASLAADPWLVNSQQEWRAAAGDRDSFVIQQGMVEPTAPTAVFRSKLKSFPDSRKARTITVEQSPAWDNWQVIENIGPENLGDAPVFLSLGPDDYWMFGRYSQKKRNGTAGSNRAQVAATLDGFDVPLLTTHYANQYDAPGGLQPPRGGYHAWQSRDMKNWVHHGPITDSVGKWMTTAEIADGKAYFYYDFPNDQDPHLYIDEDLTDGKPGKNMGLAFADPSHGSDCAFIRDLQGSFHVIAEDWSPINARTHAWDSPLATHAVSEDGIKDFEILAPAVDERTTPTGRKGTYRHPHWAKEDPANYATNIAEFEIHEPEQNAYGDWAAISVGGRYYLFCDFDPAEGHHMSVGRFTSPDINQPFEWCGHVGKGHPDPDVMFAEGRFYLATQQNTDFVSPGPWVEKVDVRVGVDTSGDGIVDQWTEWRQIAEKYDYIPGFAKQVAKTPAEMDLSSLPAGVGFSFEIRMTDTTQNASKPILDWVRLSFDE